MSYWDGSQWVRAASDHAAPARRGVLRHVLGAAAEAGLITALVFGLIASTVFAGQGGKGKGHGGNAVTVSVPDGVFGGTTTAIVSSPGMSVYNACSQNGTTVSQQWVKTDDAGQALLQLGPTMLWSGGAASCVAQAGTWSDRGRWVVQGSATFSVSG